jgi:hypothetical protein
MRDSPLDAVSRFQAQKSLVLGETDALMETMYCHLLALGLPRGAAWR